MRLVTSITAASDPCHCACTKPALYFASRVSVADFAFDVNVLSPDLNHAASFTVGTGTQACVTPSALAISSRVTIWKLRHAPGFGANVACADAAFGSTPASDNAAPPFKRSRRWIVMVFPPWRHC